MVEPFLFQDPDHRGAEAGQPSRLRVNSLLTGGDRNSPPAAGADIRVNAVFDRLGLGHHLEPDSRAGAAGIDDAVCAEPQVFLGHADVSPVLIPGGEAGRRRLRFIAQGCGPKAGSRSGSAQSITSWKLIATGLTSARRVPPSSLHTPSDIGRGAAR